MQTEIERKERIVDCALELAEASSWEQLTLYEIARELDISLNQIREYFAQKDDIVEAWFDRADQSTLDSAQSLDFKNPSELKRTKSVIMSWYLALAPHRKVTRQMLGYKFEFGHVHLQILGIMRISRTVQWFREAAQLQATGISRIAQEVALTTIYLTCFGYWLYDESEDSSKTSDLLNRLLNRVLVS